MCLIDGEMLYPVVSTMKTVACCVLLIVYLSTCCDATESVQSSLDQKLYLRNSVGNGTTHNRAFSPRSSFADVEYRRLHLAQLQETSLSRLKRSSTNGCPPYQHPMGQGTCEYCKCSPGEQPKVDCGYGPSGLVEDMCEPCGEGWFSRDGSHNGCELCTDCGQRGFKTNCSKSQDATCKCDPGNKLGTTGKCLPICCKCRVLQDADNAEACVGAFGSPAMAGGFLCTNSEIYAEYPCQDYQLPTTARPTHGPTTALTSTVAVTNGSTAMPDATTASRITPGSTTETSPSSPTGGDTTLGSTTSPNGTTKPQPLPIGTPTHEPSHGDGHRQRKLIFGFVLGLGISLSVVAALIWCLRRKIYNKMKCLKKCWERKPCCAPTDGGYTSLQNDDQDTESAPVTPYVPLTPDQHEISKETGVISVQGGGVCDQAVPIPEVVQSIVGDPDEDVANAGGADSGNVSTESLDAGSCKRDSTTSSKDSLLDPDSSSVSSTGDDNTQEAGGSNGHVETGDNDKKETAPKGMGSDETMEFSEIIEGPANDERGVNARPSGGGPNRPHQQQQPPQPPPYPGQGQGIPAAGHQPAVSISGGTFHGPVTFIVGGNHNHPAPAAGDPPQDGNNRRGADGNANDGAGGIGRQPAPHDENGRPAHLPGNGNDRARNRRHPVVPDIQVSILPNPARVDQNVRFSCDLPDNMDPHACEFRWMKRGQLDRVAQVQNFSKNVQRYDAGVYTCEVTTADGNVLEGQAVLEIVQDDAEGGTNESGHVRRAADHDSDQPSRKRPRTGTPDAQGFSNPSSQIQVPEFIQGKPLAEVLDHADLLHELEIKLEQPGRKHFKNIGSYFGISHDKVEHIEYRALGSNNSPFKWILEKVTTMYEDRTVGELLKYCDETLERRDVVRIVVDYFEKEEQDSRERETEVKEGVEEKSFVANSDSEQAKDCFKTDSVEIDEFKELRAVRSEADVAMDDVPEKSILNPAVAKEKLGACDGSRDAIELVELQS